MSLPITHTPATALKYEVQSLETQMRMAYAAYRGEQSSKDPQVWALAAYRRRLRGLASTRRRFLRALDALALLEELAAL